MSTELYREEAEYQKNRHSLRAILGATPNKALVGATCSRGFTHAETIRQARFVQCKLIGLQFLGSTFEDCHFWQTELHAVDQRQVIFRNCSFREVHFKQCLW